MKNHYLVSLLLVLSLREGAAGAAAPPPQLSKSSFDVTGKNVIVTGSTSAATLGGSIATSLAEAGASGLFIVGSRPRSEGSGDTLLEEELRKAYPSLQIRYYACQLADPEACEALVAAADEEFGGQIHGLVNAAAVCFPRATLDETTAESFDRNMNVNVRAPLLLMKGVARIMRREAIHGSIVNIGSNAAYGGAPFISTYSASKGALNTLTKVAAVELQPARIRCNCIAMGWTVTDNENREQAAAKGDGWIADAEATQRIGRLLRPADITPTVGHLLSDATTMVTGAIWDLSPEWVYGTLPVGIGD